MTAANVDRLLICPGCNHHWEAPVGTAEQCPECGAFGIPFCACGCSSSLEDLRADAVYRSEACAKRLQRAARPDRNPTPHPLAAVREDQAQKKHNRDLGGLIRRAIVDRLRTTGECFADDLIPLYPAGEVDLCRHLATAQFGSLASAGDGKTPLIREKGRRKSSLPQRKGAKSSVWEFTKAGWDRYGTAGLDTGTSYGGSASVESGEDDVGVGKPQGPQGLLPVPVGTSTDSPDKASGALATPAPDAPTSEPLSLPIGESETSAYEHLKDVA